MPNSAESRSDDEEQAGKSTGVLELINLGMGMKSIRSEMSESVQMIAEILPVMLANAEDVKSRAQMRKPDAVRASMSLDGADELYEELSAASRLFAVETAELTNDLRVRVTIVVRSLQNAAFHMGRIEEGCIKEARASQ